MTEIETVVVFAIMFIRSNISFINRNDLVPEVLEQICVEISRPNSKPSLVSSWYRPPNSKIEMFHYFEEFLRLADIENKQLIITGDLNCNLLEQVRSTCTAKLLEIFDLYLLKQHVQSATRVTARSQSLIDVIITFIDDNKIIDSGILEPGISDHHLVYICRKVSLPKESPKLYLAGSLKILTLISLKKI